MSSSDDGLDYHHHKSHSQTSKQQQQQQHQQQHMHHSSNGTGVLSASASQQTLTLSGLQHHQHHVQQPQAAAAAAQHSTVSAALAVNTIERRRKSSLSYQYQLQQVSSASGGVADYCNSAACGSPNGDCSSSSNVTPSIANCTAANFTNVASPGRYHHHHQQEGYHLFSGRLSLHPIERYDDSLATCCLPPPSPAPTNDRFVMGMPSPSIVTSGGGGTTPPGQQQHHHHHQYDQSALQSNAPTMPMVAKYNSASLQRTMSPSSRYRISDRYRDVSPKCERFVTANHFLTNSTPLVSADTYAYLSSAVHTPVKRYVPTPPPPTEIYSDIAQQSVNNGGGGNGGSTHLPQAAQTVLLGHQQSTQQQQISGVSSLPYRYRMKCCSMVDPIVAASVSIPPASQLEPRATITDHYVTTPRIRSLKCHQNGVGGVGGNGSSTSSQQLTITTAALTPLAPLAVCSQSQSTSSRQSRTSTVIGGDYMNRTPSVEYLNTASVSGGCVATPVSVVSEPPNSSSTCLHCNTIRRTTGVHQTTQTTGPISPVLQTQTNAMLDLSATCNDQFGTASPMSVASNASQATTTSAQQTQSIEYTQPPQQQANNLLSSHSSLINRMAPTSGAGQSSSLTLQHSQPSPSQPSVPLQIHSQSSSSSSSMVHHHHGNLSNSITNSTNNLLNSTPQRNNTLRQQMQRFSRKQRLREYVRREIAKFFGVDVQSETDERLKWSERQKRLALRRFGPLKPQAEPACIGTRRRHGIHAAGGDPNHQSPPPLVGDRPDILPAQTTDENQVHHLYNNYEPDRYDRVPIEKKVSVPSMIVAGVSYVVQTLNKRQQRFSKHWSRSFAPTHVTDINGDNPGDLCEGLTVLQEEEVFFDIGAGNNDGSQNDGNGAPIAAANSHARQIYMGERVHGWRTSSEYQQGHQGVAACAVSGASNGVGGGINVGLMGAGGAQQRTASYRGTRISPQLLDGVLDNSRRPAAHKVKLFRSQELDDRNDHRPFFTYWINTVQILVLTLSLICYGVGPIGIGIEHKSGQVLVTSLSLQTVQHQEQRNVWIGPRSHDLVHLGGKFAVCMRRDVKIMEVIAKTRRQERETACCIRNDDSGCVQSSQADCSVRGLWPTKSISTWKKWSPGESGPGGRISGSVCGLDPKYCDAPASIAPYEWPDDITKWPICRKTNSFSQRFRFKDQTAEHMVCEVIGHPCCTGVFGECRITTREYCDFVNGYFHEEASLCSQVSCLNNVCGMFPFVSTEVPDQFYRLFTSLCLHAGIIHLAITVAFQHIFLADLERLIGPIRTAIVYIGSGLAGNLTSAILVPYKLEVGPLASLAGVLSSLVVLLLLIHWKQLKKPHMTLMKLIVLLGTLFGMGTLPWQQNFAGLVAGLMCGMLLTIALVPFVSFTRYGRKSKINLIWACMLFHLFVYAIMFVIFYIFPSEFTPFSFGDVFSGGPGSGTFDTNILGGIGGGGNNIHQRHHHHGGEDIAMNGGIMPPSSLSSNDDVVNDIGMQLDSNQNIQIFDATSFDDNAPIKQLTKEQEFLQKQNPEQLHHRSKGLDISNSETSENSDCDKTNSRSCTLSNGEAIDSIQTRHLSVRKQPTALPLRAILFDSSSSSSAAAANSLEPKPSSSDIVNIRHRVNNRELRGDHVKRPNEDGTDENDRIKEIDVAVDYDGNDDIKARNSAGTNSKRMLNINRHIVIA